jgi:hypothetical protein
MPGTAPPELIEWLSSPANPPVRYRTALHLIDPPPGDDELTRMQTEILRWPPLREVLALQRDDGFFPSNQKPDTARATFWALRLMARCGLSVDNEPVARAIRYLELHHLPDGLSYTGGGAGVLACYLGVTVEALIRLGALSGALVQNSLRWLIDHQRFDHKTTRAGGTADWPFRAPANFGCWESVSCYHGVAGAFRALAAVPADARSPLIEQRLEEALQYLRIHRLYKKSGEDKPLFRHMTQFSMIADYRSDLLDMLTGIAACDPSLGGEDWVREAVADMDGETTEGKVTLVKNYGKKLIDPIPLEPVGEPSRFLTLEWLLVREKLLVAA